MGAKRIRLLTLCAMVALFAYACTSNDPDGAEGTATTGVDEPTDSSAPSSGEDPEEAGANGEDLVVDWLSIISPGDSWTATVQEITEAHPGATLDMEFSPSEQHDQTVQLLAANDDLPLVYHGFAQPGTAREMIERGGLIADLEPILEERGILDRISPAAIETIKNTWGNGEILPTLPFEYSIAGFWYNQTIFDDHGLQPPATWTELQTVADTLHQADVQPFSAAGLTGWPVAWYVGYYIYATLGPDAMEAVARGEAKLTDPEYVEAAEFVQELGNRGYFGPGVAELDYEGALTAFLNGEAAMYLMGSWDLAAFNDVEQNSVGPENIGFFGLPAAEGGYDGQLTSIQLGWPVFFSPSHLDEPAIDWLERVVTDFGPTSLAEQGHVSGFTIDEMPEDLPPMTALVFEELAQVETTVPWWAKDFTQEGFTFEERNAGLLVTGQMSALDYMAGIQQGNESDTE